MSEDFFVKPLEQSKVKSQIVAKYFFAWAKIIGTRGNCIAYIDLFAGQGYYEDGTESTPLLILKKAISDPKIGQILRSEFNDKNKEFIKALQKAVEQLEGVRNLTHSPKFTNITISREIVQQYAQAKLPPTLFFLDPWGYKGLSLELIRAAIKDWASECLLFFNYDRINRDLQNPLAKNQLNELFGEKRADKLREMTIVMEPYKREETIIQEFCEALKAMGGNYALPFCFLSRKKDKTSHYLIHVTKNKRGYGVMKEIMAGYSEKDEDDVPKYTFDPKLMTQLILNFNRPIRELRKHLLLEFRGQTLKAKDVYDKHQEKTRFIRENYKDALRTLEKDGKIEINPPSSKRRVIKEKVTLADNCIVKFH